MYVYTYIYIYIYIYIRTHHCQRMDVSFPCYGWTSVYVTFYSSSKSEALGTCIYQTHGKPTEDGALPIEIAAYCAAHECVEFLLENGRPEHLTLPKPRV